MDNSEMADRVVEFTGKIINLMNSDDLTKRVAIHALGGAACHVFIQSETEEAALDLFREMVTVMGNTMAMVSERRVELAKTPKTAH